MSYEGGSYRTYNPRPQFRVGQKVRISSSNDNEGYRGFRGKTLVITHIATNRDEHAGYDEGVGGGLYDLKVKKSGREVPFSLYDYELEGA